MAIPTPPRVTSTAPKPTPRRGRPPRAEEPGLARGDTKVALQDAAERLFATHGFDAVSVRAVAAEAGVDPALLHYYFGTKRDLFRSVLTRRLKVLKDERLQALESYERVAGDKLTVEGCFEAYLTPVLWWSLHGGPGWKHYFAMVAQLNNTPMAAEAPVKDYIDPVAPRLIELLARALPAARVEDLWWSYFFFTGSLTLALAETGRIDIVSDGLCKSDDIEQVRKRLAAYAANGLLEVCRRNA